MQRNGLLPIWLICVLIMLLVDYVIGAEAEFVNAWSAVLRILGQPVPVGESWIYSQWGLWGEIGSVLLVTYLVAFLLQRVFGIGRF